MGIKAAGIGAIRAADSIINMLVLTIIVVILAFAGYALWDSNQIYHSADKSIYEIYKPTIEDEGKSFEELQALNEEVFAWLSVYGTNIDYPVTQGQDNMKYVNTNAEGLYSLSGAIFLDCVNSADFSDFNSILYGHHMEKNMMFGEIGSFADEAKFDAHRYGNLYFGGENHGIEFFAFVHTDAYDSVVFTANVQEADRQAYLDSLLEKAVYQRDIGVTAMDHIILLSTCSATSTNGRDILVGRITGEVFEDTFINEETRDERVHLSVDSLSSLLERLPDWAWYTAIMAVQLAVLLPALRHTRKRNRRKRHKRKRKRGW